MNSNVAKVDGLFRQVTPLFLLGLLAMVLLEPMAPAWLTDTLGEDVVLKFVVAFLVLYVLLLWGEALRLHGLLTGLLEAFRSFDRDRAGGVAAKAIVQKLRRTVPVAAFPPPPLSGREGDCVVRYAVRAVGIDLVVSHCLDRARAIA